MAFDGNIFEKVNILHFFSALIKGFWEWASTRCQSPYILYFNAIISFGATSVCRHTSHYTKCLLNTAVSLGLLFRFCHCDSVSLPSPASPPFLSDCSLFSFIPCGCGKLFCCVRRCASWHSVTVTNVCPSAIFHSSTVFLIFFFFFSFLSRFLKSTISLHSPLLSRV